MSYDVYQLRNDFESIISNIFKNERPTLSAWAICTFTLTAITLFPIESVNYYPNVVDVIWGMITGSLGLAYLFFTIRFFRGKSKQSRKPPYIQTSLSWWGYLWRAIFILWLLKFLTVPLALLDHFSVIKIGSALSSTIFIFLSLLFIPIFSFIFFAVDRKEKFLALASFLKLKR